MKSIFVGTAAIGAFLVASTAALGGPLVEGGKLKALFAGGTLYTSDIRGFFLRHNFEWQFKPDGMIAASYSIAPPNEQVDPIERADSGTWQVRGNQMCVKFKQLFKGAQHCFTVRKAMHAHKIYGDRMFRATMANDGYQWLFALDK